MRKMQASSHRHNIESTPGIGACWWPWKSWYNPLFPHRSLSPISTSMARKTGAVLTFLCDANT